MNRAQESWLVPREFSQKLFEEGQMDEVSIIDINELKVSLICLLERSVGLQQGFETSVS